MKFVLSLLGFLIGCLVGSPLAGISLTLAAFTAGVCCLFGLEIGIRVVARGVDSDVRAFVRPPPFTYGWVMGLACGSSPLLVPLTGLVKNIQVPDLNIWVFPTLFLGPVGALFAPVMYIGMLVLAGGFLGGRFGLAMHRREPSFNDVDGPWH